MREYNILSLSTMFQLYNILCAYLLNQPNISIQFSVKFYNKKKKKKKSYVKFIISILSVDIHVQSY